MATRNEINQSIKLSDARVAMYREIAEQGGNATMTAARAATEAARFAGFAATARAMKPHDMKDRIYSGPECSECTYTPLIEGHAHGCSQRRDGDGSD